MNTILSFGIEIYIGMIILLFPLSGVTSEDYFILDVCDCDDDLTVAQCSALNMTELPSSNLEELQELYFSGNSITCILNVELQDYSSLRLLDLAQNKISEIEENAFHNLTHLEYLLLSENKITQISPSLFLKNDFLKKLYLNENPLVFPKEGAFLESKSITYLDISYCNLTSLTEGIFTSLTQLQALRLDGNPLSVIEGNVFESLSNLKEIYMRSTIDSCMDLQLNKLENYFTSHNVDYYGINSCGDYTTTQTTVYYDTNLGPRNNFRTSEYPSIITPSGTLSAYILCSVCWCSEGDIVYADCASRNVEQIPINNLTNLYHLVICDNNIRYIKNTHWINYRTVVILELSNNAIEKLEENSFQNLVSLEYLDLSCNKISNLHPLTFYENKKLQELNLAKNPLIIPNQSPFLNSKSIKFLDLSFCKLINLPDETFIALPQLTTLVLNGNPIISMDAIIFEHLDYLKEVHMAMTSVSCTTPEFNVTMNLFNLRGISYSGPKPCDSEELIPTMASLTTTSTSNATEINEAAFTSTVESTTFNMGITSDCNITTDKSYETTEDTLPTFSSNGTYVVISEVPSQSKSSKTIHKISIIIPAVYLFHLCVLLAPARL